MLLCSRSQMLHCFFFIFLHILLIPVFSPNPFPAIKNPVLNALQGENNDALLQRAVLPEATEVFKCKAKLVKDAKPLLVVFYDLFIWSVVNICFVLLEEE